MVGGPVAGPLTDHPERLHFSKSGCSPDRHLVLVWLSYGIVPSSDQCGHVQAVTHGPAAAIDRTFTAHFPTVAIKWCHFHQRRNFRAVELSQLRHLSQE